MITTRVRINYYIGRVKTMIYEDYGIHTLIKDKDFLIEAIIRYDRNQIDDCLHYLERAIPKLNGLSKKVKIINDETC